MQTENRTLDSPEVRSQITEALINQRKQILNTALLEVSMNEAEIQNNLATKMLTNPDNFGLPRPAQPAGTAATPATSPTGQAPPQATGSPTPGATATPAASPTAQASPSPKS